MFSYILFSSGKSVQLKHFLSDYSAHSLFTIKNKYDMPTSVGFSTYCSDLSHITSHAVYLQGPSRLLVDSANTDIYINSVCTKNP